MHTGWLAQALRRIAGWLYGLTGATVREHAPPPRDRRGRFVAAGAAPWRLPPWWQDLSGALADSGGREGGPPTDCRREWLIEELLRQLEALELPAWMLQAAVPLTQPANSGDVESVQRHLRSWVLQNMDRWVERRRGSVGAVFSVLERTWAIDRLRYAPLGPRSVEREALPRNNGDLIGDGFASRMARAPKASNGFASRVARAPQAPNGFASRVARAPGRLSTADTSPSAPLEPCPSNLEPGSSASLCLCGETNCTAVATAAGGDQLRPYASNYAESPVHSEELPDRRAERPRSVPAGAAPARHCNVVAQLPPERVDADNPEFGLGNTPDEARADYIQRHQRCCGADWRAWTFVPAVFEEYDALDRMYFVAKARSPYQTYSEVEQEQRELADPRSARVTRASAHDDNAPCEHNVASTVRAELASARTAALELNVDIHHRATETPSKDESSEVTKRLALAQPNSASLCLCGETNSSAVATTAGGDKLRPYASNYAEGQVSSEELRDKRAERPRSLSLGNTSPSASLEPCPSNLTPDPRSRDGPGLRASLAQYVAHPVT